MALVNIPAFSGLNILAAPQRIRDDEATVAIGCDFRSQDLRPFKGDKASGIGTSNPTTITNVNSRGGTIYQWDSSTWIGVLGDKTFARAPTFYTDSSTGQRLFVCDNAPPYPTNSTEFAWNWVQEVEKSNLTADTSLGTPSITYFLNGTTVRLGVPKPAAFGGADISHVERNGVVTQLTRYTNADSTIQTGDGTGIKVADKLILDVPGIGDGPFTVSKKTTDTIPVFTLRNSSLTYQGAKVSAGTTPHLAIFTRTNHGLIGGEQVIINVIATTSAGFKSKLPTATLAVSYNNNLFTVAYLSPDTFSLNYASTGDPFVLLDSATGDDMRFAVVAGVGDEITDVANVSVYPQAAKPLQQVLTYAPGEDAISTWQAALDTLTERSYVVTFVNKFGDESEPSDPTKGFLVAQGDPVTFSVFPVIAATYPAYLVTGPGGSYQTGEAPVLERYRIPEKIRLYRTDSSGTYRLVTTEADDARTLLWSEVANPDGSPITINWVDKYEDAELGEPLSTQGWQIPPRDLNGILISPGGSLVGYKDRGVFGSVPYAPYAFPIGNRVAFDYNVKGLVATSSGIVVVTEGMPALIVGDDPAAWSIQKLEYPYGCVSRRSIVDMGEMAIYASADGLVGIVGANVEILTKDAMTRAQWQSLYNPSQIFAAHAEGRYYGVTTLPNGTTRKAFMFDPRTRTFTDMTVDPAKHPIALYSRLEDDTLLIMKSDGLVYEWNRGTDDVPYTWVSKAFQMNHPDIMGCCQIIATALVANKDFIFRLYGWDGESIVLIATFSSETVVNDPANRQYRFDKNVNPFRLPLPVDRYTVFQVGLEGTLPIAQVSLAGVIDELKQI